MHHTESDKSNYVALNAGLASKLLRLIRDIKLHHGVTPYPVTRALTPLKVARSPALSNPNLNPLAIYPVEDLARVRALFDRIGTK